MAAREMRNALATWSEAAESTHIITRATSRNIMAIVISARSSRCGAGSSRDPEIERTVR